MIGTLVNAGAIVAGGCVGMVIHSKLPKKIVDIVFQGLGLITLTIGISMAIKTSNMILIVVSVVLGAIIGQAIDIDKYLRKFSDYLSNKKFGKTSPGTTTDNTFTEGFVTASILFCIGSMSILGAIEDGMGNPPNLLYTKSVIDLMSAIALASSFGICIIFSSIPVLIYQGGLTLFAAFIMRYMSDAMIADMTSVGGILLIGLGISILKIKEIKVINMLPSVVIVVFLSYLWT
ncbi:DUF554 domain-containing protein [Dysgonomonas sp. 520]|uniref:DUF554 domain-containing protein n=1 Tax=Dysgonomonas sp. 520 TaxID=2302931 RepID=UPI0013D4754F|nr:DUF554 domain-containing protein [Dysgonomonas sp. 520]NDW09988.1 DUF554 domain-containing protein [Dysgonomonas sp. 520]